MGGLWISKKSKMKYYFDFDNTLVKTHHLKSYMSNHFGRDYLINNPDSVETALVNPRIVDFIRILGDDAEIISNSPEKYVQGFLRKHNFPDIRVRGNAKKPCSYLWLDSNSIYIGDEPLDVLFAHEKRIPSIAYTEGGFFPKTSIEKSQPSCIAEDLEELARVIGEGVAYKPRILDSFSPLEDICEEDFEIHPLWEYYSPGNPKFKSSKSRTILDYKNLKDYGPEELVDSYFFNGRIIVNMRLDSFKRNIFRNLRDKIDNLELKGSIEVVGLPNSLPEFAYLSDSNHDISNTVNGSLKERMIYRVKPVKEAHTSGFRNARKHIGTLGVNKNQPIDLGVDNIV